MQDETEWPPPEPAGNPLSHHLDRQKGNLDYVPLNLTPWTPMAYRTKARSHLCFFEISPTVATRNGVIFTDSNAARTVQQRGCGLQGLDLIKFEFVRSHPVPWDRDWFNFCQAEVLVPTLVRMSEVTRVAFVSEASLSEGKRFWGDQQRPNFEVDRTVFADRPNQSDSIDFSHVANIILTTLPVSNDSAWEDYPNIVTFDKKTTKTINALVEVWVLAGARGTMTWRPSNQVDETVFAQTNKYRWFPGTSLAKMHEGKCSVEVRLNNILWTVLEFEVV